MNHLLVIMNSEPAIVDIAFCETIEQAKMIADDFVYDSACEYQTEKWIENGSYPHRKAVSLDAENHGELYSFEIVELKKVDSFNL